MTKAAVKTEKTVKEVVHVKAVARYVHVSPRKARLIADLIRGNSVGSAIIQLQNSNKSAAKPVLKLLLSAVANAENNFQLTKENLKISTITVDGGPPMKRWKVRAYGRASGIRRPTSHIFIILEEGKAKAAGRELFPVIFKRPKRTKAAEKSESEDKSSAKARAEEGKSEAKPKSGFFKKNIFNRKGGEK